jgi:hypothetical protein
MRWKSLSLIAVALGALVAGVGFRSGSAPPPADCYWVTDPLNPKMKILECVVVARVAASSVGIDGGQAMKLLAAEIPVAKVYAVNMKWDRASLDSGKYVLVSPVTGTLRLTLESAGAEMGGPNVMRVPSRAPPAR